MADQEDEVAGLGEGADGGNPAACVYVDLACLLLSRGLDDILKWVLLLLDPRDLKACRQVCCQWNTFIKKQLWGTTAGRRRLESKAAARWRVSDAIMVPLGRTHHRSSYYSLHVDDKYIFCGQRYMVSVYSVSTGLWVRDLHCGANSYYICVAGASAVVAAASTGGCLTFIWRKAGTMKQLHQGRHHPDNMIKSIAACDGKVVTGGRDGRIVVLEEGEAGTWSVTGVMYTNRLPWGRMEKWLDCAREWVAAFPE